MQFSITEDIEAPTDTVWAAVTDFKALEKALMRRGAEVQRLDPAPGAGARWQVNFQLRGKKREALLTVTAYEPPETLKVEGQSGGVDAAIVVELVALEPGRTRMTMDISIRARTMAGKVLLQSMKLAKGTVRSRVEERLADFVRQIEAQAPATR